MTPEEFKALQEQIGWNNRRLASALKVTEDTVSVWRGGRRGVPGPAQVSMKALASGWRP